MALRKKLAAVFVLAFLLAPVPVLAQDFPNRNISLIIGYAAGGATDLTGRSLADAAQKILGQPVVVVNKPGGTSSVALSVLMNEKPDGYTLGVMPSGGVLASLLRKVPYDPVKDFTPVIQFALYEDGLAVRADSPWKTLPEFIEYAKNNPGKIRYASSGAGTPEHLIMERVSLAHKIKWLHLPFEGDQPASVALLGGHVDATATSSGGWKAQVEAGKFRLLATFHDKRTSHHPQTPTLKELGYDMVAASLICIVGPKGLPEPVVTKLHNAFEKAMHDSNFLKTADTLGVHVQYRGPKDLQQYIQKIVDEDGAMIQKLGLRK